MHSVETVTVRESREDKYSMIDRGEQYSCVPLTFPPWLLPAPDLSHLSWLPKDTDSLDMILFTPGIKTLSKDWLYKEHPALNLCGYTHGRGAHRSGWGYSRCGVLMKCIHMLIFYRNRYFSFLDVYEPLHTNKPKTTCKVTPVPRTCWRCINSLIVHLTFLTVY